MYLVNEVGETMYRYLYDQPPTAGAHPERGEGRRLPDLAHRLHAGGLGRGRGPRRERPPAPEIGFGKFTRLKLQWISSVLCVFRRSSYIQPTQFTFIRYDCWGVGSRWSTPRRKPQLRPSLGRPTLYTTTCGGYSRLVAWSILHATTVLSFQLTVLHGFYFCHRWNRNPRPQPSEVW